MLSIADFQVITGLIRLRPPQQSVANTMALALDVVLVTRLLSLSRVPWIVDVEGMASFCRFWRFATLVG
jgi:hypothetical protein